MTRCGSLVKPGPPRCARQPSSPSPTSWSHPLAARPPCIGRTTAPVRGRLVAARGGLPDLPAVLRRLERRRCRRPGRDHRPPRPPRSGRPRCGRHLAVADLPVARARPRLRRQRPRAGRPAVRDRGGLRPAGRRCPRAGDPGHPRPGDEPHQRRAPLVRVVARRADRPVRRLVSVGRPGRCRGRRHAAAAEQLGVVLRRAGLAVGAESRAVLLPHVPGRAARARLADAGGRGRPVRDGPRLAGARRRRLPARCLQRVPQGPRAALEPGPARDRRPGRARSMSTTATSPTCRS